MLIRIETRKRVEGLVACYSLSYMFIFLYFFPRLLSSPTCPVLEGLGKKLAFEIAVGLNGRVWVYKSVHSLFIVVDPSISF